MTITKTIFTTIAAAAAAVLLLAGSKPSQAQAPSGMHEVWSDEFNGAVGSTPNSATWQYDLGAGGWGNNEQETYVNSQANCHIISDGTGTDGLALQIEAQTWNNNGNIQWYSARINSNGKHNVGPYGYFEYRCKFPGGGQGYWPAAWMLGTNIGSVGWPACGEIDIAEEIDSQSNNHGSLHSPNWNPTATINVNNATGTYHNYGANWQPSYVTFYCDGGAYETQTSTGGPGGSWVFNSTDFLLINLAIGGSWPGNTNGSTQNNGNFDIDYVRQYEF
jgi:beta-glucanase (GH16 family)